MEKGSAILIGNWKMHKTVADSTHFIEALKKVPIKKTDVRIATPFTALYSAAKAAFGSKIAIGAQNVNEHITGPYTGEISALMVREAGATFSLVGHSERRHLYHESDAVVAKKVRLLLETNLQVVLCVGEKKEERERGETELVLAKQIHHALNHLEKALLKNVIIAYEPVWAIGSKTAACPKEVEEIHKMCKNTLLSQDVPILYGGSVTAANAGEFLKQPHIDGLLIGGASLEIEKFQEIIQIGEALS